MPNGQIGVVGRLGLTRLQGAWWRQSPHLLDNVYPSVAADFSRQRYMLSGAVVPLSSIISLSSTTKWVVGANSLLQQVAANTPAFDYSTGRRRLLLEPAPATNLCLQSNALGTSAWTVTGTVSSDVFVGWSGATDLDRYAEIGTSSQLRTAAAIPIVAGLS